jgi:hypothetical protein
LFEVKNKDLTPVVLLNETLAEIGEIGPQQKALKTGLQ